MSTPCTVIIGAAELLDALRESAAGGGEVLSFEDKEPLKALEAITTRQPNVIALERLFAATSRGAALINRIKADPALAGCRDSRRIARRHLSRLSTPYARLIGACGNLRRNPNRKRLTHGSTLSSLRLWR